MNDNVNNTSQYKYDAFISYRHTDLDMFVASELHKYLETYKPPKSALKASGKGRIQRVFRDQEELPLVSNLEDPIIAALKESEFLIVICSPRIKESAWCKKEIETFIQFHGRERVLAVLIEGEPEESFPDELIKGKKEVKLPTGQTVYEDVIIEPLAADFRAENKAAIKKKMGQEALRLLAPIYGVDFDDLRQRHKERRTRKIIAATTSVAAVAVLLAVAAFFIILMISAQNKKIKKQSDQLMEMNDKVTAQANQLSDKNEILAKEQAKNLANEAEELYDENKRIDAIMLAVSSLTDYEGVQMPYTANAYRTLAKATRVYTGTSEVGPLVNVDMEGQIKYYDVSSDGKYVMAVDDLGDLKIWVRPTYKEIYSYNEMQDVYTSQNAGFVSEKEIVYLKSDEDIVIHNLEDGTEETLCSGMKKCYTNENYVVAEDLGTIYIYDVLSKKCIWEQASDGFTYSFSYIEQNNSDYTIIQDVDTVKDDLQNYIYIVDNNSGELVAKVENGKDSIESAMYQDGVFYFCGNIFGDSLFEYSTSIKAYDLSGKKTTWEKKIDDTCCNQYCLTENYLAACSYDTLYRISLLDGSIIGENNIGDTTLYFTYSDGYVWGIVESGNKFYYEESFDKTMETPFITSSKLTSIKQIDSNYIGVNSENSSLVEYGKLYDDTYTTYTGNIPEPEDTEILFYDDAIEKAKELGVEHAGIIGSMLIFPDTEYALVNYKNKKIATVDINTGEIIDTITASAISKYYGKDSEGRNYVDVTTSTLAIDSEGMFLFEVENMQAIADDGQHLILSHKTHDDNGNIVDEYYTVPIFATDDLIAKGKQIVKYYRN